MCVCVHVYFYFSGKYLGVELLDIKVVYMLKFILKKLQVFWNGWSILYFHWQYMRIPVIPHPHQLWVIVSLLILVILVDVKWYLFCFKLPFPQWLIMLSIFSCIFDYFYVFYKVFVQDFYLFFYGWFVLLSLHYSLLCVHFFFFYG